jgi:hypothetical protein
MIVGAAKAGTTSLFQYLRQHPEIFLIPQKETNFFAFSCTESFRWHGPEPGAITGRVRTADHYERLLEEGTPFPVRGEVSPLYLYSPTAAQRIAGYAPGTRVVIILRNPVDRAYSHFLHLTRDGREPCADFEKALEAEDKRRREHWFWDYLYTRMGFYSEQIRRFLKHFPERQVRIFLFEDLLRPHELLDEIMRFVGVDRGFRFDISRKFNVSSASPAGVLGRFVRRPNWAKSALRKVLPDRVRWSLMQRLEHWNQPIEPMSVKCRERLIMTFHDEIESLGSSIGRDLSSWKDLPTEHS